MRFRRCAANEGTRYHRLAAQVLHHQPVGIALDNLSIDGAEATVVVKLANGTLQNTRKLKAELERALGLGVSIVQSGSSP